MTAMPPPTVSCGRAADGRGAVSGARSRGTTRRCFGWLAACLLAAALPARSAPAPLSDLLRRSACTHVSISPDGRLLAAITPVTVGHEQRAMLAILDRATRKPLRLLDPGPRAEIQAVTWVDDRRVFLTNAWSDDVVHQYRLDPGIIAMDVDGTHKRSFLATVVDPLIDDNAHVLVHACAVRTTQGCRSYVQLADNDGMPVGARLATSPDVDVSFFSDNAGRVLFAYAWGDDDRQKLWFLDAGRWRVLNDEAVSGVEVLPIGVSRDGAAAYLRSERKDGPDAIERFDIASGRRAQILRDAVGDPREILWSADGRQPIGALYGDGVPQSRFWNADDPDAHALRALELAFPDESVRFVSGTRDGRYAVVAVRSDRDPGAFYLYDRDSGRTDLIARAKPWLSPSTMARAQPVTFVARDGTPLDGYLTLPQAADASLPLVVMPHGGPFDVRDAWEYDEEVQLLAAHGYAVLRVNYRGSAGRGRRFVEAGYRQWGGRIQEDIADGVRWAIAQGRIDPARVCIWGTSFGGYAALMGAVRAPDLYRCAISTSGPTDLRVSRRWGDTQRIRYGRRYLDRTVGDDPDALAEQSPLNHVDAFDADVLLVHGRQDERIAFEHARRLSRAMQRAGKPLTTLFLSQEGHAIQGEDNRRLYYATVLDFLAEHLGVATREADHDPVAGRALVCRMWPEDVRDLRRGAKHMQRSTTCPLRVSQEEDGP